MAKFPVSAEKELELELLMQRLGLREADLEEKFIKGGGPGGQKINKTSSCVYIKHAPSGLEVKCQSGRSQAMNRFLARRELCRKFEALLFGKQSALEQAHEKIRRQKRRRTRRGKEKMLERKKQRGNVKRLRARPQGSE